MVHGMAPPHKKRRLSPSPSHTTLSASEPAATFVHSVEHLEDRQHLSAISQPAPHFVQEVHLQILERPVFLEQEYHHGLHRRQDGLVTVESVITTVDAAGSTILSTMTNILPTVTTPSTASTTPTSTSSTSTSNTSDGFIGSGTGATTSTSTNSSSTASTQSGTLQTSTGATLTHSHNNGTATHRQTGGTTSDSTSRTSLKPVFLTTRTNGNVRTFTRSNKPYVTTFADGEQMTICDRQGACRMSTQTNDEQSTFVQTFSSTDLAQSTVSSAAFIPGGVATQGTAASPTSTSPASNNDNSSAPPAGTIAGGVVGGAAGLAVILVIALMFLRWYKRRRQQGHQALPPSAAMSPVDNNTIASSRGAGMAERAGLMPFAAAVPGLFRHQNRSVEEPPSSERGFTRVSGRKLPSQFSEGMSSPPANMPLAAQHERDLSNASFYRDSYGFYGGPGGDTGAAAAGTGAAAVDSQETPPGGPSPEAEVAIALSPGPRRTPTVHTGGPYVMSPSSSVPTTPTGHSARSLTGPYNGPHSPTVPPVPAIVRSETPTSVADTRSSRFTEEV